jgi:restriction endonuclease S subunit
MSKEIFFKFISDLNGRLDFQFYNPEFDKIKNLNKVAKFKVIKLGDQTNKILTFMKGGTTPKKLPLETTPEQEKVLFLKNENIKNGELDLENKYYIFRSDYEGKLKEIQVKKGDILFSMTGTLGNACLIREDIEASINQNVVIMRFDENKVDLDYMDYYLNSDLIKKQIEFMFTSAQTPYLNDEKIKDLRVVLPDKKPNNIQKVIVDKIRKIEEKIWEKSKEKRQLTLKNNNIIAEEFKIDLSKIKYTDCYSSYIEDLDYRLDFIWNNPELKKIWEFLRQKKAVPITNFICDDVDYGITDFGREKGEIPFINIENINFNWKINHDGLTFIDGVNEEKRLSENEILISRSRMVGLGCLITKKEDGFTFGSYLLRLKPKNTETPSQYLVNFINSSIGKLQTFLLQTGSSGNNINPDQVKQIKILINEDIKSINGRIEDNFKEIIKINEEISKTYQKAKEVFLQELIA